MLFTIAIPTYNNGDIVSKAINSAINQNYEEKYEVLIVNNASTDNTKDVLSKYESNPKVRVKTNETTVDQFENHNVCFREAKGDYVVFIHSDDELYPYALSIYAEELKRRQYPPRFILWGHSMFRDYQTGLDAVGQRLNEVFGGALAIRCFLNAAGLAPSGTCYSRQAILNIGAFPPMSTRTSPLDWYILLWAAINCFEFEMIDRMVFLRTDASTATNSMPIKQVNDDKKEMFDILFSKLNSNQKKSILSYILHYGSYKLIKLHKEHYSFIELFLARIKYIKQVVLG